MGRLRIAALQFNPRIGHVADNIEKANRLLYQAGFLADNLKDRAANAGPIDILVLPELAFTGYNFKSKTEIQPYLETTASGISAKWAKQISNTLTCHTLVGYPEKSDDDKIYNSAAMLSPSGQVLFNYRKSFLYYTDEDWGCSEGDGFHKYGPFESLGGRYIQAGICMDLNPYKFTAPFNKFEFASSALSNDVSLVLCPMAWLHNESPSLIQEPDLRAEKKQELEHEMDGSEPLVSTINYWLTRMFPLFENEPVKKIAFVACNRVGWEDDVLYAGSSTMATFDASAGESSHFIKYHGSLGMMEDGVLYREVEVD